MTVIEAHHLTRHFNGLTAVDGLSFGVGAGEIVGLLGANGAGKTTTMRMLLGLLAPSSGTANLLGQPALSADRRLMGYVPQGLGLYRDLTVSENLRFVAGAFGVDPPSLETAGLGHVANRRIGEIPLGTRRQVAFVAARCHNPPVLILDEPTSGVGPLGRARLWETIHRTAESGTAILVSTHYMEEAGECERVVVMAAGREVVSGSVSEIVGSAVSVAITGEVAEGALERLRDEGGTVLVDGRGWRVVGLDVAAVSDAAGLGATVSVVPASFEETFVSLST
ncbi:MAG TPA: ABC transporter ATP-binding protein [Acidimicrobiia bacterium]|nr:ABC transporter ATP-binding protein [Acidimicrobiia bacterium]